MKSHHVVLTVALVLAVASASSAKDDKKQEQIDDNRDRITALEEKTTLDDLWCQADELASFDGVEWVCSSPPAPIAIYEVRRSISLESHPTLPQTTRWDAFCDLGDEAIGGGYETPAGSFSHRVTSSHRGTQLRVWSTSIAVTAGTITLDGAVYAYCIDRGN